MWYICHVHVMSMAELPTQSTNASEAQLQARPMGPVSPRVVDAFRIKSDSGQGYR